MVKKYNRNSGWYKESQRHSLARQGVKTGRSKPSYANDVTIQPTTIGPPVPPKEEEIMDDVDNIVAESQQEVTFEPTTALDVEGVDTRLESVFKKGSELSKEIDEDISALEREDEPLNVLQKTWSQKVTESIKKSTKSALQAYKDINIGGINKHLIDLEGEKLQLQDRVDLIGELKKRAIAKEYRDEIGVSAQLKQVSRINKLLAKPQGHLRTIDNTVAKLNKRLEILTRPKTPRKPGEKKPETFLTSIFPTPGELLHPERLRK